PDDAAAAFERAIALRPSEASPYLNLARLLLSRGDRAGAIRAIERARAAVPDDPRVAARLAELRVIEARRPGGRPGPSWRRGSPAMPGAPRAARPSLRPWPPRRSAAGQEPHGPRDRTGRSRWPCETTSRRRESRDASPRWRPDRRPPPRGRARGAAPRGTRAP